MIRQLKLRHIAVAGADRVTLTEQIAVMDLMALGRFVLQREDDLNLAALLRSPLCNLSEDDLFTLCHGRGGTVWQALAEKRNSPHFEAAHVFLSEMLARADYALSRYEESRSAFETALRYQPASSRIQRGMGLTLEALGRASEAERYLKEAAAGNDKDALSDYGQFLFRQGRLDESLAVLQRSGDRATWSRDLLRTSRYGSTAVRSFLRLPLRLAADT